MNVLSVFDGMSCGQMALKRVGIKYDNYYASEIKKLAIKFSKHWFPKTIHIGDIKKITRDYLDRIKIDLLIGGSPCQDLSIGKIGRQGLQGTQSGLFWEYVRIKKEAKPKWFLLENVGSMDDRNMAIISEALGVYPIRINSSLISAQLRDRLYWTNIPGDGENLFEKNIIQQPKDKKIKLQDILTGGYADRDKSLTLLMSGGGVGV